MSFTINIINDSTSQTVKSYQISDINVMALKDSILGNQGVLDWIENAVKGKIQNCRKRMMKHWYPIYLSEETPIPGGEDAFITDIVARPDYLDREAREQQTNEP